MPVTMPATCRLASIAGAALAAAVCSVVIAAPAQLAAYGADPKQTTVSGLSSGAFMAVQLQVAYSGSIVGSGAVAGGPSYCAGDNTLRHGEVPGVGKAGRRGGRVGARVAVHEVPARRAHARLERAAVEVLQDRPGLS